ncbi:MAG: sensor histidine kinase [Candidatus Dormibacteria bacterium]
MPLPSAGVGSAQVSLRQGDLEEAALVERLQVEIEEERRQLADRLNDDPVQTMAHIARLLRSLEHTAAVPRPVLEQVVQASRLAEGISHQLRRIARQLRPPLLDDVGLGAALTQLADDFQGTTGIPTSTDVDGVARAGGPATDLALFRVAQAVLQRVEIPAGTSKVEIGLRGGGQRVILTVRDHRTPVGVEQEWTERVPAFVEIRQRVRSVGGRLAVRSFPGHGTVVRVSVPRSPAAVLLPQS